MSPCRYVHPFYGGNRVSKCFKAFCKFQEILHEDSFKVRILSIWKDCERQDVALLEGVDAILGSAGEAAREL